MQQIRPCSILPSFSIRKFIPRPKETRIKTVKEYSKFELTYDIHVNFSQCCAMAWSEKGLKISKAFL